MSERTTMTAVLHGESGTGKSWLGGTVVSPRLILDIEGRAKHIGTKGRTIFWDLEGGQPPPQDDGTWDTCIAQVTKFSTLPTAYQWLRSGQHPFRGVSVDSLMEAQKRWVDQNMGDNQLRTQDWGAVLRALETFVRNMRDVVQYDESHVDQVAIICGSVPDDRGRARPLLQGSFKNTLPYYVDVVGWLSILPNPTDPTQMQRVLNVGPTPWAIAKDGTGKLGGPEILIPDSNSGQLLLTDLYNQLEVSQ
jgi:hypothetical protein